MNSHSDREQCESDRISRDLRMVKSCGVVSDGRHLVIGTSRR